MSKGSSIESYKYRCDILISNGWRYDKDSGNLYSPKNRITDYDAATARRGDICVTVAKSTLVYYICTGEIEFDMSFKDGNKRNYKFENLMTHLEYSSKFGVIKQKTDAIKNRELRLEKFKQRELEKIEKKRLKEQRKKDKEELKKKLKTEKFIKSSVEKNYKVKQIRDKNYLADIELFYEIIIAKGKGKMSPKIEKMFYDIIKGISSRFSYSNPDDRNDCEQEAYYFLLKNYDNFNDKKYNSALPYFTEVAKRAMAKQFNLLHLKDITKYDVFKYDKL